MVCLNSVLNSARNVSKPVIFDTSHNFSSVYHSLTDKSYDTFISASKSPKQKTNPILDAVKKAVPFTKDPRVTISDNMTEMIKDLTKVPTLARGKDAVVYSIPNHPDLVLRVEQSMIGKMDKLSDSLELVPISFPKEISENKHLGLPLYYVTSKGSTIAKKTTISPLEAMTQPDKIMVLRKVSGVHPSSECSEKLISMVGLDDCMNPDADLLNNFSYVFGYVKSNYGTKAAAKALEYLKSGETIIPPNALGEGSAPFEIVKGKEFYQKYCDFSESYINSLKYISEFPQQSYDDAVKFIISPKNFNVDFQHTNNTFVNPLKQEFNFMDFAYDKKDSKYIYDNPVKSFRNVLYGKCCLSLDELRKGLKFLPKFSYPRDFIVTPEYIEGVKTYSKVINEKINLAAPEKFKSEKVCS